MNAVPIFDETFNETFVRLSVFLGVFLILAVAERLRPRRVWSHSWQKRWINNIALGAFNSACLRLLAPFSGTVFAAMVQENNWALVNLSTLPTLLSILLFVVIFDLTIYWQHRLFHWLKPLWVFHRVHHTDLDYDLTTGNRFHPVSIVISMAIKLVLVLALGALPVAILIAEVLLNVTSMFNHSNIRLPAGVDRVLRLIIVTPDMHRVHHSVVEAEHGRNFGFNFSCWDRLFGSYLESPALPQESLVIGIEGFAQDRSVRVDSLLLQPFWKADKEAAREAD
jgi:sterol desaturase/sphingolipid hydroxylase (fatty acid hydroxylase superfamily)